MSGFSPIITTASPGNAPYLTSLGATHVLDRHAPLEHPLARRQGPDERLQRRLGGGREHVELVGHVGEPLGGEPQPVQQAAGHAAALGGVDVRGVRG